MISYPYPNLNQGGVRILFYGVVSCVRTFSTTIASQIIIFIANHYIVNFLHICPGMSQRLQIYVTNVI